MDSGYLMLTQTCSFVVLPLRTSLLVVLPLRTSPLVVQLYGPPRSYSNTRNPATTNLSTRSISQVWARNIRTSLLVFPHESIRIWTSPSISSHVHHHPWICPLMTQYLLIQVLNHCVQTTHANHCLQPYRLALPKRRQATILCRPPGGTPLSSGAR